MKLKFNRSRELEIVGIGVFKPNQIVTFDDEKEVKRYLDSGYFNEVKERKKESKYKPTISKLDVEKKVKIESNLTWGITKGKSKPFEDIPEELEIKKSKKKGVDK